MILQKKFRCRGSLWNEIRPSNLGNTHMIIERPVSLSALRRKGIFVRAIDVLREEIPLQYRRLV